MPQDVARRAGIALLLALGWLMPVQARAQASLPRADRIEFARGADSAIVRGAVRGLEVLDYVVAAEAGQRVQAELTATHSGAFLNVRAPGAMQTTHVGPVNGNVFEHAATTAGEYRLSVFLLGEAARRGEMAEFTLSVTVAPAPAAATPEPAPAPAATAAPAAPPASTAAPAEPAAWSVTGLPRGQQLNLRAGPSTRDRVVGRLAPREVVLNRGCRVVEAERWCQVVRPEGGAGGWATARFLAAAAPPAVAPQPATRSAARGFDATGFLPCAMVRGQPSRDCRFGVERAGAGAAVVEVLGANGVTRRIVFERGAPVRSDAAADLAAERFGELFLIRIGDERFEVPEAVVTGG